MRAFVISQPGAQTIELVDVPVPIMGDDELLVRVCAVGVGIHDSYFLPTDGNYPYPIGIEAAGVVEEIGSAVRGRHRGDRIAFVSSMQPAGGTWAEYAVVKADALIIPVPDDMDFVEAAAVPVAGNTVLRTLSALAEAPRGASMFIAGASGAIGTFAIQLARKRGWRIAASASAANHDYMLSLGAHRAVDYRTAHWPEDVLTWMPGGVDVALAVQPNTSAGCLSVVKDSGSLISISGDELVSERGIHMTGIPYDVDVSDELAHLMEEIVAEQIHVELEQVYPFDDALVALAKVRTRSARGKVVLSLE